MTTPVDELRAAADKLRSTCNAAAPGPWTIAKVPPYTDPLLMSRLHETPDDGDVLIVGNIDVEPEDQAVVQLLHPGVGTALVDWLDAEAAIWAAMETVKAEYGPKGLKVTMPLSTHAQALAVARAINGAAA